MTSSISLREMGSSLNGVVTGDGSGSQGGLVYVLGELLYTSVKKDSADDWVKQGTTSEPSSPNSWDANLQNDLWHSFLAFKALNYILAWSDTFFSLLCSLSSL